MLYNVTVVTTTETFIEIEASCEVEALERAKAIASIEGGSCPQFVVGTEAFVN